MRIVKKAADLGKGRKIVLAAGFFDGVHRGHQKVICKAVDRAAEIGGSAWVLTFATHPLKVLKGTAEAPRLLTSTAHRLEILRDKGIDGCLIMSFTKRLSVASPEAFIQSLCRSAPAIKEILVGKDWRFGRGASGDTVGLDRIAREMGVKITTVPSLLRQGKVISSTDVRELVLKGKLSDAKAMLGRPFSIRGKVVVGRTVGRKLGYPTANLKPENEVHPPGGVYIVRAQVRGRIVPGVLNIGIRPTFKVQGAPRPSLELHLLDFDKDLYGETLEVFFLRHIRSERRFRSERALSEQIARDVALARRATGMAKK